MSTGLNCEILEVQKPAGSQWYYILENWDAPKLAWDWRDYATAYGPFTSGEQAQQHLDKHHANPGGWSEAVYSPEAVEKDTTLQRLLSKARR